LLNLREFGSFLAYWVHPARALLKEFRVSPAFGSTVACVGMVPIKTNKKTIFVEMGAIFACQISTKLLLNLSFYAEFPSEQPLWKDGHDKPRWK